MPSLTVDRLLTSTTDSKLFVTKCERFLYYGWQWVGMTPIWPTLLNSSTRKKNIRSKPPEGNHCQISQTNPTVRTCHEKESMEATATAPTAQMQAEDIFGLISNCMWRSMDKQMKTRCGAQHSVRAALCCHLANATDLLTSVLRTIATWLDFQWI